MIRYLRFYVSPVVMFLIAFAMFFGGIWLWLPAASYVLGISLLDQLVPLDLDEDDYRVPFLLDVALYLSTPAALAMFFALFWVAGSGTQDALGAGAWMQSLIGVDVVALRNQTPWYHFVFMFPAIAIPITAAGGLAGHELTHRTWKPFDLWLGRFTMALNWGIAFPIEHVYGHHAYIGTKTDPATAARGDSVYAHVPKAMYRTIVNAWEIETTRLDKLGASFFSPRNVLLRLGVIAFAMTVAAYLLSGWMGVLFYLTVCVLTKVALEALNYVEHYGIVRVPTEPVQPRHSWNCNHLISSIFTYNLTRHSHHHADAQVPFQKLRAYEGQPKIPGGFMTAYLTVWVPPLWRKRITPKLREWDEKYASQDERALAAEANERSRWAELTASSMVQAA
ncbi:MAG: hypothetical protein DRH30_01485 [Deltaproteobacteria bacterium]|nr:MAG: hypothetical protein DRH30_01485 [Deltaproteobacteria bacterium]